MATISGTTIVSRTGFWHVDSEEAADVFMCTCSVGSATLPATYTARVSADTLKAAMAAASHTVTLTDVQVEAADFAHVSSVLSMACVSGKISARALLNAAVAAGEPLPAAVLLSDASESLLRRHAGVCLEKFESWAEHLVSSGGTVASGLADVASAHAELKRLRIAYRAVSTTRVPAVTPTVPPGGTTTTAAAVPALGSPSPFDRYVKYTALKGKAADDIAWEQLTQDVMVFIEPNAEARAVRVSHKESCAAAIEGWLETFKGATSPAEIGKLPGGLSAGEMLAFLLTIRDAASATAAVTSASAPLRGNERLRVTMRSGTGTEVHGKSEVERREVTRVQSDVLELEQDDDSLKRLHVMRVLADADDAESRSLFEDAMQAEGVKSGALHRLLTTPAEIGCITLECEPSTVDAIMATRSVLDASLERAVFGSNASLQSDTVLKALRPIRLQRLSRCRMLNLLDQADGGTEAEPLSSFAKLGDAAGQRAFFSALQIMQSAWTFAAPKHTASVIQFITQYERKCQEAFKAGVGWDDIGQFHRLVFRRVDKAVIGFAAKQAKAEPPEARWAKEPCFEWVVSLNAAIATATATSAVRVETEAQQKALRNEMNELRQLAKRPAPAPSPGGPPATAPTSKRQKQREAKAARAAAAAGQGSGAAAAQQAQKLAAQQKAAAAQTAAALTAAAGAGTASAAAAASGVAGKLGKNGTLKEDQAKLTQEMGNKDGKPPCWFFHKGPTGCFKTADDCRGYH
jgi:hypothetical protein